MMNTLDIIYFFKKSWQTIEGIKKNHERRTTEIMQFEQKENNLEK